MADEWITPQEAAKRMIADYEAKGNPSGPLSKWPVEITEAALGMHGWVKINNTFGVCVHKKRIFSGRENPFAQAGMCVWYEKGKQLS